MKEMTIAVISDIHVGSMARSRDLCPLYDQHPGISEDDYQKKFLSFLSENSITADYLLLPGDITHKAKPAEVTIASEFIERAAREMGVSLENVVYVPGNHDVDWGVINVDPGDEFRRSQRYETIADTKLNFSKIMNAGEGTLLEPPYFAIWNFEDLLAVGYNSSHHDDPNMEHYGLIDPQHAEAIRKALDEIPSSKDQLRLFLVHHHPRSYSAPTQHGPDSIMLNSEKLLDIINDYEFDILVHGHLHLPRFLTESRNSSFDVVNLCSGSFSAQIDTQWAGEINNQFHVIKVEGRDEDELVIKGCVESWTYILPKGWMPSVERRDSIPHIEPFGKYIRPPQVIQRLRPIIQSGFKKCDFIQWKTIVEQAPEIGYLPRRVMTGVLAKLGIELGFAINVDQDNNTVLFKEE